SVLCCATSGCCSPYPWSSSRRRTHTACCRTSPWRRKRRPAARTVTQPGWYRDPVDEFEWRWWSGQKWTEDVRTGRFAGTSPLAPTPIPAQESALWSAGPYLITTHAAHVPERGRDVA